MSPFFVKADKERFITQTGKYPSYVHAGGPTYKNLREKAEFSEELGTYIIEGMRLVGDDTVPEGSLGFAYVQYISPDKNRNYNKGFGV